MNRTRQRQPAAGPTPAESVVPIARAQQEAIQGTPSLAFVLVAEGRRLSNGFRVLTLVLTTFPVFAHAAEKLPDLRPPLGEIPPDFWEQHHTAVVLWVLLAALAITALILWLRREKPLVVIPPHVTARQALAAVRNREETPALAAEVSRTIRHYVLARLHRVGEEPTTEELVRGLSAEARFSPAGVQLLASFLRDCDVQKFAPARAPQPGLVTRALALVDQFESQLPEPAA